MPLLRLGFEAWRMHRRMRKFFDQAQNAGQQPQPEQPRRRKSAKDKVGEYVAFEEIPADDTTTSPESANASNHADHTTTPRRDPIITDVDFEEIK
ncbi:MAG: hypothetical protein ACI31A_07640 [Candidatus Limisoma sp.]